MTRAAYFECFAGASGDMILGALVDAGWPETALRAALEQVRLTGWTLDVRHVKKGALHATQVRIDATEPHTYSASWEPGLTRWFVDDREVRTVNQAPGYPLQLMLDIYEFPVDGDERRPTDYPKVFEVDWVRGIAAGSRCAVGCSRALCQVPDA